ncbi:MAG: cytochrome d ubiquinol oxidase subunit II, partial [Desulfuromonadales bacterium]|nr:cytochrome d ubiquinol oxidase subunit II [Desulfuromonadales bacterium]
SSINPASNLTIFNSSSSLLTLQIMTVVAAICVPTVICYKIWVYRIFRARVSSEDVLGNPDAY